MPEYQISDEIRGLLRDVVDSHEKLAIMLLLRGQTTPVDAGEICTRLNLPGPLVKPALLELYSAGLLVVGPRLDEFAYQPADARVRVAADALADAFRDQPLDIVKQMSANSMERLRNSALTALANAFLFRVK